MSIILNDELASIRMQMNSLEHRLGKIAEGLRPDHPHHAGSVDAAIASLAEAHDHCLDASR